MRIEPFSLLGKKIFMVKASAVAKQLGRFQENTPNNPIY